VRVVSGAQAALTGDEDWYLLAPVTFEGPRGPVELCAFLSADDNTKVVVQIDTGEWDADGKGVQLTYNDADAVQYRRR
jgi:hypothetical protein